MQFDREMPASEDAERNLIACCLADGNETIARCINAKLSPSAFFKREHQIIYGAMLALWSKNPPVSLESLSVELTEKDQIDAAGGWGAIASISGAISTTLNSSFYIEVIGKKHQLRQLIRLGVATVERAYASEQEVETLLADTAAQLNAISSDVSEAEAPIQKIAEQLAIENDSFIKTGISPKINAVPWGIRDLDVICRPMEPGELIVLGGRPSTGKSALADQVAWNTASALGHTLVFTYEMSKREKAIRIAQQVTRRNFRSINGMPKSDQATFSAAFRAIRDCKHLHVFERDTAVSRLTARARSFHARAPIRLIVVDFLQYLARLEPLIGKERTDEKIGRISAALKNLAIECSCPVLMLASLNREGEREGRPPRMSDLRASGEIESDADVIALLHWPETNKFTNMSQDPHDSEQSSFYVDFNQEKGRNKGVHQVGILFNREATLFTA